MAEDDRAWRFEGLHRSGFLELSERLTEAAKERSRNITNENRLGFGLLLTGAVSAPVSPLAGIVVGGAGAGLMMVSVVERYNLMKRGNRAGQRYSSRFQKRHGLTGYEMWKIKARVKETSPIE